MLKVAPHQGTTIWRRLFEGMDLKTGGAALFGGRLGIVSHVHRELVFGAHDGALLCIVGVPWLQGEVVTPHVELLQCLNVEVDRGDGGRIKGGQLRAPTFLGEGTEVAFILNAERLRRRFGALNGLRRRKS